MAIHQTRAFFARHPHIRLVESEDTAKSAAQIAHEGLKGVGAVASELAAKLFGLEIIAPGIETSTHNFTRFIIFDDSLQVPQEQIDKASLCFTLPHTPGSLAHILTILSFIKFEDCGRYTQAISAVRPLIDEFRVLGEYHSAI